ncbi:MAG: LysR family transcriptional regulator [Enterococcus sp.]|nr:LysR family transcriptional regulator [Enterococcus sp.]
MEIRALQYFVAVVENGSITAAARELHMSQPPLSTQIKSLEKELGTVLFIRHPRNVEMTDAGKVLYERAKSMLAFAESTTKELENFGKGVEGTVRIGIPSSCDRMILSFVEESFHKKHPNIYFEITEANTYELLNKMDRKNIDLALVRTPYEINESLYDAFVVENDRIMALGSKAFFEGIEGKKKISASVLADRPLITYRRWEPIISSTFMKEQTVPNFICISDSAHTAVTWAEHGLGIAIVPETAVPSNKLPGIVTKQVVSESLKTSVCAISRKDSYLSPCTKLFMDEFRERYQK